MKQEEKEIFTKKPVRKYSDKSTRDDEPSPRHNIHQGETLHSGLITWVTPMLVMEQEEEESIKSSPILSKQHYQDFGLFEDISFSTNIPSYRLNSFCNSSAEGPFDLF